YGAGTSEGTPGERLTAGIEVAPYGAAVGGALPLALRGAGAVARPIIDYASPTVARWGANVRNVPRRLGIPLSADGAGPLPSPGAVAAAEQIIANAAVSGGMTGAGLRRTFGAANEPGSSAYAARYSSSGAAQDVLTLADTHPAMQRLLGSTARR